MATAYATQNVLGFDPLKTRSGPEGSPARWSSGVIYSAMDFFTAGSDGVASNEYIYMTGIRLPNPCVVLGFELWGITARAGLTQLPQLFYSDVDGWDSLAGTPIPVATANTYARIPIPGAAGTDNILYPLDISEATGYFRNVWVGDIRLDLGGVSVLPGYQCKFRIWYTEV